MELNFERLEMQKWRLSKLWSLNVKNGSFFVFSADDSKKVVSFLAKYLSKPEGFYWVLSENGMINMLLNYCSWDIEGRNIKKLLSQQKTPKSLFSGVDI